MKKKYKILLILAVLFVSVKLIFVGSNGDEEYCIEMAWRLARGDRMLLEMWEPHQTSAIFGAALIKLFWLFSGSSSTGIVLFLHFCGVCIQLGISYFLYRVLRKIFPESMENFAFLAGCVYALCYVKGIVAPEFTNLPNWFMTCSALCLILFLHDFPHDKEQKRQRRKCFGYLMLSGICLSGAALSYPSMVILYPVEVVLLCCYLKKERPLAVLLLTLPCLASGGAFAGYLFSYMNWQQIMEGLHHLLEDGSHASTPWRRIVRAGGHGAPLLCRVIFYYGVALAGTVLWKKGKRKKLDKKQTFILSCFIAMFLFFIIQIAIWLFREEFVNQPQAELIFLCILSIVLFSRIPGEKAAKELMVLVIFSATELLAFVLLSSMKLFEQVVCLGLGAIGGMGILCLAEEKVFADSSQKVLMRKMMITVMSFWVLALSFGRCWVSMQGGDVHTTPMEIRNIRKSGPAVGMITNYISGYRYNIMAEEWDELTGDAKAVMYAGPTAFYYMFGDEDMIISAPNTICTPVYDENLLDYWEEFPERYPDVVLVESVYGELFYEEDSFIVNWLNTEYQASTVTDYEFVRVYRK